MVVGDTFTLYTSSSIERNSGVEISSSLANASSSACRCFNDNFFCLTGLGKSATVWCIRYFFIKRLKLVLETCISSLFRCDWISFSFHRLLWRWITWLQVSNDILPISNFPQKNFPALCGKYTDEYAESYVTGLFIRMMIGAVVWVKPWG